MAYAIGTGASPVGESKIVGRKRYIVRRYKPGQLAAGV